MIKQMAIVKRRPDMTHREYLEYIEHVHGSLSKKYNNGTLLKYVQNHIYDGAYGFQPDKTYKMVTDYDSVTELYFESIESIEQCFHDPDVAKHIAGDGVNFADESRTIPLVVEEQDVTVANRQEGGQKILYYLKKADDIEVSEFWQQLDRANIEILPTVPGIFQYVKNIPIGKGNSEHFHNEGCMAYEGVVSLWVNNLATFREYQRKLESGAGKQLFFNPSYGFFVCCDEAYII